MSEFTADHRKTVEAWLGRGSTGWDALRALLADRDEMDEALKGKPVILSEWEELEAEVERLAHLATTEKNRARDAEAEVERLKAALDAMRTLKDSHFKAAADAQAEVERLKAAKGEWVRKVKPDVVKAAYEERDKQWQTRIDAALAKHRNASDPDWLADEMAEALEGKP